MKTFSSIDVADFFLYAAQQRGEGISAIKLQKLIYFAHGWHLALLGHPLLDENIVVKSYGPTIGSIYDKFKYFGNNSICLDNFKKFYCDKKRKELLNKVWDVYRTFSAIQLSNISHKPGSPWDQAYKQNMTIIPDEIIKKYFIKQLC